MKVLRKVGKTIPKNTLKEFNDLLDQTGCAFHLVRDEDIREFYVLELKSNRFVRSCSVIPNLEFRPFVDEFFTKHGIKLSSNNEGTVYWIA